MRVSSTKKYYTGVILFVTLMVFHTHYAYSFGESADDASNPVIAGVVINSCVGSITISVTSGVAPYTYQWEDSGGNTLPSTSFVITGLGPDNYTVTVTDANGDFVKATYTVTNPPDLVGSVVVNDVTCRGDSDAQVIVTMANGNPGYNWELFNSGGGSVQSGSIGFPNNIITIGGLGVDTYSLEVTDQDGCTGTIVFTITEPAQFLGASLVSQTNATCSDLANGSLEVTGTGGWGGYTYVWRDAGSNIIGTSASVSGLLPGTYSVLITDANGCQVNPNYTITGPAAITATSSITDATCNGASDGVIDITAGGGNGGFTYLWSNGATTEDISGVTAGSYSVTITDSQGCTLVENYTIDEPAVLTINEVITNVDCFGDNTGRINSNVTGGTAPYSYSWSNGRTNRNNRNIVAGSYSLTVTDANGCTTTESFTVTEPSQALSITSFSETLPSCFGSNDGTLQANVVGGTAPYSYAWSNGDNTATITGLTSGIYTVTVTDANGCTTNDSFTLNDPTRISIAASVNIPSCNGGVDGSITATASDGTAPYTYNWNTGDVGQTITGLSAGTYTVTVTDAGGCTEVQAIVVGEPSAIQSNAVVNNISCSGLTDGSIFLGVTGGTAPYTYSWSTGATTANISGLSAGSYSVTITDGNGCMQVENFTVVDPAPITATYTKVDVLCRGNTTGSIDLTPAGGTAPYSYLWSTGAVTEDVFSLAAGSYSVTVTDASGCNTVVNVTIDEPATILDITGVETHVSCNGGTNGAIDLTVTGGIAPYSYSWNTGSTNEDITALAAGSYSVQVTDANGCVKNVGFTITQPAPFVVSPTLNQVTCNGADDGSVTLAVSGGTAPYTYSWADGPTTQSRSGLSPGNYTVTVTDANGCQNIQPMTITEPSVLGVTYVKQDVNCFGESTGTINLTVTGGTAPYSYSWSNGSLAEDLINIAAGTYNVTVTDANGCSVGEAVTISEPAAALSFTSAVQQISCNGLANGQINLSVTGGTAPYTYNWSNGSSSEDLSSLSAATYTVTITDALGCTTGGSFTITDPPVLSLSGVETDVTCNGSADGSIDLTVTGGEAPYTYAWAHGPTTEDVTGLGPGSYSVQVTDNRGCSQLTAFTITEPTALTLSTSKTDVLCFGESTGKIDITVTGGTAPYSYNMAPATFQNIAAGSYTIEVTDANGCFVSETVVIDEPAAGLAVSETMSPVTCNGLSNGSIDLTVTGGTGPYTYAWNDGITSEDRIGLAAGNYNVTITDANGCQVNDSYTITEPFILATNMTSTNVTCLGADDGSADLTITGGTAPYSMLWSDGVTTEDRTGLAPGSYTVTVTDANGCQDIRSITITEPADLVATAVITDVDCFGNSTGAIDLTASGGTAPYTYAWSTGASTEDLVNLAVGSYIVTVTDANGCTQVETIVVDGPAAPLALNPTVNDISCFGANDGEIQLNVTGGTAPYSYNWNTGATTSSIGSLLVGNYNVTVIDANGCTLSGNYTITTPAALQLTAAVTDLDCNAAGDGAIDLTVTGGTAPYSFNWSNGSTTEDLSSLSAGNYQVVVTDANGCSLTRDYTVTEPLALTQSGAVDDVSCFGVGDGAISVSVTGGVTPYSYSWSSGEVTEDLFNISGGSYTLTVTDANGCQSIQTYTVAEAPSALSVTESITNLTCKDADNGAIDITVSGGTAPYSYSWNQGATTEDVTGLSAGIYQVTVTDANGCQQVVNYTVTEPDQLTATYTSIDISCFAAADGAIDITVAGGTAPYTYSWSDGSTDEDRTSLDGGSYTFTVTDAQGCQVIRTVDITEPTELTLSATSTDVLCFGEATGAIDLSVSGGTAPYSYAWTNGATTEDLSSLPAGTYTVLVTDANGCIQTETVVITEPMAALSLTGTTVDVSCQGLANGSIDLTVTGGTSPYSYFWNDGSGMEDRNGLSVGTYSVTVTDANGCETTGVYAITEPDALTASSAFSDISCFGANDGSIDITIAGGTSPYAYSWSDGASVEDRSALSPGNYTLTVTDANGCQVVETVTISEPAQLVLSTATTDVLCFGEATGAVDLLVTGGTAPYSYTWTNGAITEDLNNLTAGTYSVTVTDANGCTATETIVIAEPVAALSLTATPVDVTCQGLANGSIDLVVAGGTAPYSYSWADGSGLEDRNGLIAGDYSVTVTDANGCQISGVYTVNEPAALTTSLTYNNVSCFGVGDGAADLTVSGGTSPYSFLWSDGSTTEDRSGLTPGVYAVTVTDANGCQSSENITITEPAALSLNHTLVNVDCYGNSTGSINITLIGGTEPYSYSWSDGSISEDLTGLVAGDYTITATDANGCQVVETISITQPSAPLALSAVIDHESCKNASDGAIDLSVTGGTAPYSYSWNTGASIQDIVGLLPGTYQVTVIDANGCSVTEDYVVTGPETLTITAAVTNLSCRESGDGAIDLTIAGGTAPYTYAWSGGETTEDISGLSIGGYAVLVTDANGCTAQASYTITQPLELVANWLVTDVSCFGGEDGAIDLAISGGTAPYDYAWSNGQTTQDLTSLTGGTYSVVVSDALGCQVTAAITVEAPSAPLAATAVISDAGCNGLPSGMINITVTGGTAPYSYAWTNGSSQPNLVNVFAGSYGLVVTDINGCQFEALYEIEEPDPITATFNVSGTSCFGDSDGSIEVMPSGGQAPYSYVWSNGSTSQNQFNLVGGTYNVTITDANNCSVTESVVVGDSRNLAVTVSKTDILCKGEMSGMISLNVTGGSGSYTYLWNNGSTSRDLSGVAAGVYDVVISDDGGCATTASVVISEPSLALSATIDHSDDMACFGQTDGFGRVVPLGGIAPYTYLWSTGARTPAIDNLTAGNYTVSVTDANGCVVQESFTIRQPEMPLTVMASGNLDLACLGNNDGNIVLDVSGGTAPYTFLWSTGSTRDAIADLGAGDYTVRVVDAVGCVQEKTFTVTEPEELRIEEAVVNESQCYDDRNGSIQLEIAGGTQPYSYQWSNQATTKNIIGISSGTYSVIVTDARGCTTQASYTLSDPALFRLNPEMTEISCVGENDASISLNIEGGVRPLSIRWNTGNVGETITDLSPGVYNVTVTDDNGCTLQQNFNIIEPLPVTLDAFVQDAVKCGDPRSGRINLIVTGGREPYTYRWSNGATTQSLVNILPGTYAVRVRDRYGCEATGTYSVQQPEPLRIGLRTDILINCETREVNNRVVADVSGGFGGYQYQWSRGGGDGPETIVSEPGRLTLLIIDDQGCELSKSIDITIPELGEADFEFTSESIVRDGAPSANDPVSFFDQSFGDIIDWAWDFGDGFDSREVDPIHTYNAPGTYRVTLTVTDGSGCTSTLSKELEITEGYRIMIPDAFTPNGDGNNDYFRPRLLGLETIQLMVFNTWGEVIFSTDDVETKGWNGMINGKPAENGNYVYKLIGFSFNGLKVERDGVFALIN